MTNEHLSPVAREALRQVYAFLLRKRRERLVCESRQQKVDLITVASDQETPVVEVESQSQVALEVQSLTAK
jgi:hypothetical protein